MPDEGNAQAAPPSPAQAALPDPEVAKLRSQVADLSARLSATERDLVARIAALEQGKPAPPRKPGLLKHRRAS